MSKKAFDRIAAGVNQAIGYSQAAGELQRALDRIAELEDLLGTGEDDALLIRLATGLPLTACKIVSIVRKRAGVATRDMIYALVYGARAECDRPDQRIIEVEISKARARLRPLGIEIRTIWSVGYVMDTESRRKLAALMAAQLETATAA